MNFKINNKTGSPVRYEKEIHSLCDFAQNRLGFKNPPSIFLNHDERNAGNTLGKTGYYDPETMEIHVFATGRHPKDILRSIAHELVHHNQNERGELKDSGYMGKGYAQKNPHMRKMELQANDPMLFRDWEDSIKEKENTIYNERRNRKMSLKEWKNKEIGGLLTEKWGFKMDLGKLNEQEEEQEKDEDAEEKDDKGEEEAPSDSLEEKKKGNKKPDKDGDGVPDWADKHPGKDDHAKKKEKKINECGEMMPPMQSDYEMHSSGQECITLNGLRYCPDTGRMMETSTMAGGNVGGYAQKEELNEDELEEGWSDYLKPSNWGKSQQQIRDEEAWQEREQIIKDLEAASVETKDTIGSLRDKFMDPKMRARFDYLDKLKAKAEKRKAAEAAAEAAAKKAAQKKEENPFIDAERHRQQSWRIKR